MLLKISITIPVAKNTLHKAGSEKNLLKCVKELLENYEYEKKPKGEVFIEDAMNVGLF